MLEPYVRHDVYISGHLVNSDVSPKYMFPLKLWPTILYRKAISGESILLQGYLCTHLFLFQANKITAIVRFYNPSGTLPTTTPIWYQSYQSSPHKQLRYQISLGFPYILSSLDWIIKIHLNVGGPDGGPASYCYWSPTDMKCASQSWSGRRWGGQTGSVHPWLAE